MRQNDRRAILTCSKAQYSFHSCSMFSIGFTTPRWYTFLTALMRWFSAYEPIASLGIGSNEMKATTVKRAKNNSNNNTTQQSGSRFATTKQHEMVNIQRNIVACPTYPEQFTGDNVVAPFVLISTATVTLPFATNPAHCGPYDEL